MRLCRRDMCCHQSAGKRSTLYPANVLLQPQWALRVETARVKMTLVRYDEVGQEQLVPVDGTGAKFLPPPNEFVYLRTTVTNLSRELFSYLRPQP